MPAVEDIQNDDEFNAAFEEAAALEDVTVNGEPAPEDEIELDDDKGEEIVAPAAAAKQEESTGTDEASDIAKLKATIAAQDHAIQSEKGRVRALQNQLEERSKPAKPEPETAADDGNDGKSRTDDFEDEYPEVSQLVNKKVGEVGARLAALETKEAQKADEERQTEQKKAVSSFFGDVAEVHPDFNEIRTSPDFKQWYQTQTKDIQRMANSWESQNGINTLNLFKATRPAAQQERTNNNDLLDDMLDMPSSGGPKAANQTDDFDRAFDEASARYGA